MKKGKDYGLLISSMVAIVAIVGLVIMFSGTSGFGAREAQRCVMTESGMECYKGGVLVAAAGFEARKTVERMWQPSDEQQGGIFPGDTEIEKKLEYGQRQTI